MRNTFRSHFHVCLVLVWFGFVCGIFGGVFLLFWGRDYFVVVVLGEGLFCYCCFAGFLTTVNYH